MGGDSLYGPVGAAGGIAIGLGTCEAVRWATNYFASRYQKEDERNKLEFTLAYMELTPEKQDFLCRNNDKSPEPVDMLTQLCSTAAPGYTTPPVLAGRAPPSDTLPAAAAGSVAPVLTVNIV